MKKQLVLIGGEPSELEKSLLNAANHMLEYGADRFAVVGAKEDGTVATGYCNMETYAIGYAAVHLLFEAVDKFIMANLGRYRGAELDEDGCGIEEDDEPEDE